MDTVVATFLATGSTTRVAGSAVVKRGPLPRETAAPRCLTQSIGSSRHEPRADSDSE